MPAFSEEASVGEAFSDEASVGVAFFEEASSELAQSCAEEASLEVEGAKRKIAFIVRFANATRHRPTFAQGIAYTKTNHAIRIFFTLRFQQFSNLSSTYLP